MREDTSLWARWIHSFHVNLSHQGPSCLLFTLRSGRWQLLVPRAPQQSPWGWGGRICWIAVWGALVHIWRPEVTDDCDNPVYWCGRRRFHFTRVKLLHVFCTCHLGAVCSDCSRVNPWSRCHMGWGMQEGALGWASSPACVLLVWVRRPLSRAHHGTSCEVTLHFPGDQGCLGIFSHAYYSSRIICSNLCPIYIRLFVFFFDLQGSLTYLESLSDVCVRDIFSLPGVCCLTLLTVSFGECKL